MSSVIGTLASDALAAGRVGGEQGEGAEARGEEDEVEHGISREAGSSVGRD
jgi:hypothetical protein